MVSTDRPGAQPGPLVVLIGPPGSGKTSAAQALSTRLGVSWHDTDAAVEQAAGCTITEIFADEGEAGFRARERAAVAHALATETGVLSLGGGAVLDPGTQGRLAGRRVVFLDVGIADAAKRIGFDRSRPLLAVNPRGTWVNIMQARRPIYEGLAGLRVDTAGRTPDQVADVIAAWLRTERPADPAAAAPGQEGLDG